MLELRPTCENCNTALPPDSTDAMICTLACTFCHFRVVNILGNVCPNCGGGLCPRPIRPKNNWKSGDSLGACPASATVRHRPVDLRVHQQFAAAIKSIPPQRADAWCRLQTKAGMVAMLRWRVTGDRIGGSKMEG